MNAFIVRMIGAAGLLTMVGLGGTIGRIGTTIAIALLFVGAEVTGIVVTEIQLYLRTRR